MICSSDCDVELDVHLLGKRASQVNFKFTARPCNTCHAHVQRGRPPALLRRTWLPAAAAAASANSLRSRCRRADVARSLARLRSSGKVSFPLINAAAAAGAAAAVEGGSGRRPLVVIPLKRDGLTEKATERRANCEFGVPCGHRSAKGHSSPMCRSPVKEEGETRAQQSGTSCSCLRPTMSLKSSLRRREERK